MRFFTIASALSSIALAAKIKVEIPASSALPNPATLPASAHAVLLGPSGIRYDAPIRRDASFVFDGIIPASYLLTLHAHEIAFPPLRVDVTKGQDEGPHQAITAWQTFRGNEWSNKGPSYGAGIDELTIRVHPLGQKEFYQARGGFNILNFLKSPMILMALFSVVMIFGMPYLMENMDPETKAEFEEMQKKSALSGSSGAASQLQNFDLAGFLSGKSGDSQPSAAKDLRRR